MSLNQLLQDSHKEWLNPRLNNLKCDGNLLVDGTITGNITLNGITIDVEPGSIVPAPPIGNVTIFADSEKNDNVSAKNASNIINSLSSALSDFIVGPPIKGLKYSSIQTAINDAKATGVPQTVIVTTGVYNENITLYKDVNLMGGTDNGPEFQNNAIVINGTISLTSVTGGETTISNLTIKSSGANNALEITGVASNIINLYNLNIQGGGTGSCIHIDDPNTTWNISNCYLLADTRFMNILAMSNLICRFSTFGLFTSGKPIAVSAPTTNVIFFFQCFIFGRFELTGGGQTVSAYCLIASDDNPVANVGPLATFAGAFSVFIGDNTSSNFIVAGTGTFLKALDALGGTRTVVDPGLTVFAVPILM